MKRVRKYSTLLQAIRVADPKTRIAIIRSAPDDFIKTLIEVTLNFLRGNLKVARPTLTKLRQQKNKLRRLAYYRGKTGVAKARKELGQQRGGIFPLLIPLIAGLAGLAGVGSGAGIAAAVAPSIARNAARSATNSVIDTAAERVNKLVGKL